LLAQISFTEVALNAGIDHVHKIGDFQGGGGAAVFDYDNDGLEDLYLTSGRNRDHLYKNNGNGTYTEVGIQAGLGYTGSVYTMGVIAGDIDNDGDRDLFITTRGPADNFEYNLPNLLYQNNGDGTFTDISAMAGIVDTAYSTSAAFGDINEDGYLDIFVGNFFPQVVEEVVDSLGHFYPTTGYISGSANFLYLNKRDGSFLEAANLMGVQDSGCVWAVRFTDFDHDTNADLYIGNDFGVPLNTPNTLFQNTNPPFPLTDISVSSGADKYMASMGIAVGDYDENGFLDYYVTNAGTNVLLRNNGDGTFDDVAEAVGVGSTYIPGFPDHKYRTQACFAFTPDSTFVGSLSAELLLFNEGILDTIWVEFSIDGSHPNTSEVLSNDTLFVSLPPNTSYEYCELLNTTSNDSVRITYINPPSNGTPSVYNNYQQLTIDWGTYFMDFDNDTDLDLYVINGALNPLRGDKLTKDTAVAFDPAGLIFAASLLDYPNSLFENQGDGTFIDISEETQTNDISISRGGISFDYEEDGDMDMLVICHNYPEIDGQPSFLTSRALLYRNDSPPQNWLKVKVEGVTHNRDGIGAMIRVVTPDGRSLLREVSGSGSVMSHNSLTAHFGLASYTHVDTVEVRWQNGCRQIMLDVAPNQTINIKEGELDYLPESIASCGSNTLSLSVPTGYASHMWGNGSNAPSISFIPTQDTTVGFAITDVHGCTFTDEADIILNPSLLELVPDSIEMCVNTPTLITPVSGPYNYTWSTGDTTPSISINDNIDQYYYLSVDNAYGCSSDDSIWITFLPYPNFTPPIDNMSVCQRGDSIQIVLDPSPYSHLWNTGDTGTTLDLEINEDRLLILATYSQGYCEQRDSIHVSVSIDEQIIATESAVCQGDATTLYILNNDIQYLWETNATTNFITVAPSQTDAYEVVLSDSSGCSTTESILIEVYEPQGGSIAGLDTLYCLDNSIITIPDPMLGGSFIGTGIIGNTFDPVLAEIGDHLIQYPFVDSLGCNDTLSTQTEVWGICPSNFFLAIGEGDIQTEYPHLAQMMAMANRFQVPVTLQLTAEWIDSIALDVGKQQELAAWHTQGHEIGIYHIDAKSADWDGYSNEGFAMGSPNYRGSMADLLDLSTSILPPNVQIWSASSTKPDTSWVIGVPFSTLSITGVEFAFETIDLQEYFAEGSPFRSAACQLGYAPIHVQEEVDTLISLYSNVANIHTLGLHMPLSDFAQDSSVLENWFTFIEGENNLTVREAAEQSDCFEALCGRDVFEPNDTRETAAALPLIGTQRNSLLCAMDDVDWFYFDVYPDKPHLRIALQELGANYQLALYDDMGVVLDSSVLAEFQAESILFPNAPIGRYYLKVWGKDTYQWQHKQAYSLAVSRRDLMYINKEDISQSLATDAPSIRISPNPAHEVIQLSLHNWVEGQEAMIRIWDTQGKQVFEQSQRVISPQTNCAIITNALPSGSYWVEVQQGNINQYTRLHIQH